MRRILIRFLHASVSYSRTLVVVRFQYVSAVVGVTLDLINSFFRMTM